MNELATIRAGTVTNADIYRASTDAAGLCGQIVKQTAKNIQGRRYVCVEGWQAIAIAHGCTASADQVERVNDEGMGGFKATGIVRRMSDGAEIARAEGFLGDDEGMWNKRPVYARRAMVQTRAISRACRSAFAHVVVMIDANLSTTPAEEVPFDGFDRSTGEIVDAVPAEAHERPSRKPVKLDGPYTSPSALRGALKAMVHTMEGCGDLGELIAFLETKDAKEAIEQCQRDLPSWWSGGDDMPGEFVPLEIRIANRKRELEEMDGIEAEDRRNPILAG